MTTSIPYAYPDELLYSRFSRYFVQGGFISRTECLRSLFVRGFSQADIEFAGRLKADVLHFLTEEMSFEHLLMSQTMLPVYGRFASPERLSEACRAMMNGPGDIRRILHFPAGGEKRHLRFCPVCAVDDRSRYGETYWHRGHQISGIPACPEHGVYLINTGVLISSEGSPGFCPAEMYVQEITAESASPEETAFAVYMRDVFQSDPGISAGIPVGDVLTAGMLGTPYISVRGKRRYPARLHRDLTEKFQSFRNTQVKPLSHLHKVLDGYADDFETVCQTAFLLGLSPKELTDPKCSVRPHIEKFDAEILRLREEGLSFRKIARETGISEGAVRKIVLRQPGVKKRYDVRKGIRRNDWERIDREMLENVRTVCERLYNGCGGRPQRVTQGRVCRELQLPDKRFDLLPKCSAVIKAYEERQEEYWARECVWAYQLITAEDGKEAVNWTRILRKTNLRRKDFEACRPFIKKYTDNREMTERMMRL